MQTKDFCDDRQTLQASVFPDTFSAERHFPVIGGLPKPNLGRSEGLGRQRPVFCLGER